MSKGLTPLLCPVMLTPTIILFVDPTLRKKKKKLMFFFFFHLPRTDVGAVGVEPAQVGHVCHYPT